MSICRSVKLTDRQTDRQTDSGCFEREVNQGI